MCSRWEARDAQYWGLGQELVGGDTVFPVPAHQKMSHPPAPGDRGADANAGTKPAPDRARDRRSDTHRSVDGRSAPREPHERDESADSGTGAPSEVMQKAHDDVVSGRTGTDKGEATEEVYGRTLRDRTPGKERD